jgi:glycerol-3-phosphate dehydrogenase
VVYHDGQFDDARLLIHLVRTAVDHGATVLNYAPVSSLTRSSDGSVNGVVVRDSESSEEWHAAARVVINAAGPFCDEVRRLADPSATPIVAASQGSHVVLDRTFLPGHSALLVPETPDGRVLFAIPWHGHTLVGTTDVAIPQAMPDPRPAESEIDFVLETAGRYLSRQPRREDVLSTWAGIRPLVKAGGRSTATLSRDHTIRLDAGRLLTITGGKWTTYRHMAEDCVNRAVGIAGLSRRPCRTAELHVHGYCDHAAEYGELAVYGCDAPAIQLLIASCPELAERLHPALPYRAAEVIWAVRNEMVRTVEDVLARRTRAQFLNASAAMAMAPRVAELMAREIERDAKWIADQVERVRELASGYLV